MIDKHGNVFRANRTSRVAKISWQTITVQRNAAPLQRVRGLERERALSGMQAGVRQAKLDSFPETNAGRAANHKRTEQQFVELLKRRRLRQLRAVGVHVQVKQEFAARLHSAGRDEQADAALRGFQHAAAFVEAAACVHDGRRGRRRVGVNVGLEQARLSGAACVRCAV